MELETINKLYLELSQVTTAKSANDLALELAREKLAKRGKLLADIFNCDEAGRLPAEINSRISDELMS